MTLSGDGRPDPDSLLQEIRRGEKEEGRGKLKIFFGMCAGVGKTYGMLKAAHEAKRAGIDLVIGYIETHGRPETGALLAGLDVVPRKRIEYKGTTLEEMDLDAVLARKPTLALVDELAHTNVPGSRHTKRYVDVQELLDNGIDVYTTLNVQHLESRADTVAQITGSIVRETVPDSLLERADAVELIDLSPDELLQRLSEGKVYAPDRSRQAVQNFFRKGNLTALREMALRLTAEQVDHQLRDYMRRERIAGPWKSGQRLIVGISESPHSAGLIRWTRRLAFTLGASWVAVHVETSRALSEAEKQAAASNVKLARELGAEIVSTVDDDVANAIIRVARQENCTQILIGKSEPGFLQRKKRLLRTLIERSGQLDVYVIGGDETEQSVRRGFALPRPQSGWLQYATAAVVIATLTAVCLPFAPYVGYQTVALIFLFAVAILPLWFGIGPVLLAASLSALAWDFLFIPPLHTFTIGRLEDALMFLAYFSIATVTGLLTARARTQERAVRQREERAVALYTLSRDLSLSRSKDAVAKAAVANVKRFFGVDVVLCLGQTDGDIFTAPHPESTVAVDQKEVNVAAWVYWNERKAGKNTDTLPSATATYYPISGPRYPLGVLGVQLPGGTVLSTDQETLLENFIRQIASALERETLNEIATRAIVVEESERLYKTLFNSVSHEMRTPIAAIMSASENLAARDRPVTREVQTLLVGEIHEAAGRMNRLVANLLDMTRLESGHIRPKLDWCDVQDLLNSAVQKMEKELSNRSVRVETAPELPLVKMDFALMEQVLSNLLLNAALYTPAGSEVVISARREGDHCEIVVADNGPGIRPGEHEKIFGKFYRIPGSQAGGTGLGLSIARGFVEAHNGTIAAENRGGGGARFVIRLPLEPAPPLSN